MKTLGKQKEISSASHKLDAQSKEFQGKLSFILHAIKVILILSFTESPYLRNAEETIKNIKTLFSNYEKQDINISLLSFIFINLGGILSNQIPSNSYGLQAITEFNKYLTNQIEFQQFFENFIKLLKEVILLVKKNGSRSNSIKTINDFSDYLTNYSQKLDIVKKASSLKNIEEEEKMQSAKEEDKIRKKKLKKKVIII